MTIVRPAHDPELDAALEIILQSMPVGTMNEETVLAMRDANLELMPGLAEDELAALGITRRELEIPVYEGALVKASVFARSDHAGTGPGIYHVHGGGMITGHRLLGIQQCLPWIVEHDAVVLTVEYRLAPEFPDPYPVEDSYAGLVWMHANAPQLGIDPAQILIAGASAGGGLSAGTALLARDRKGPALVGQVLMCPMLDDRDESASTEQITENSTWTRDSNRYGWSSLLGERKGGENVSIYAAPARAGDLSGLPPTYIDCGSAEVFRDEDVAYASKLWEAGIDAELHVWAGGFHGFDMMAPHAAVSQAAIAARDSWVARHIGRR